MRRSFHPLFAALLLTGCKPPPEAPTRLEDLCAYVFTHMADEDPEELVAGLDNLDEWLSSSANLEESLDGYTINKLDEDSVDSLDEKDRDVGDLVGAAVASQSGYKVQQIVPVLILADQNEVTGDEYKEYERTFSGDPECFAEADFLDDPDEDACDFLQAEIYTLSSWAGLVEVGSTSISQYRWVETEAGWVFAQRSWMVDPAELTYAAVLGDLEMEVRSNYYIQAQIPRNGRSLRMQATWIDADYGKLPIEEDYALQRMVSEMQSLSDQIESYLDKQGG